MKLNIYMKSGNVIPVHGVKEWKANTWENSVITLSIEYTWFAMRVYSRERLIVRSIDLSQIEAITIG